MISNAAVLPTAHAGAQAAMAGAFPLMAAREQQPLRVCSVRGGDATKTHLAQLGFVAGAGVRVVSQQSGNLIVQVKGSRIALDRQMTLRIMVCGD